VRNKKKKGGGRKKTIGHNERRSNPHGVSKKLIVTFQRRTPVKQEGGGRGNFRSLQSSALPGEEKKKPKPPTAGTHPDWFDGTKSTSTGTRGYCKKRIEVFLSLGKFPVSVGD